MRIPVCMTPEVGDLLRRAEVRDTYERTQHGDLTRVVIMMSRHPGWVHRAYKYKNGRWRLETCDPKGEVEYTWGGCSLSSSLLALSQAVVRLNMAMRKPDQSAAVQTQQSEPNPCVLSERWPSLTEHLSSRTWDDGSGRQTSTITISTDCGRYVLCLRDRALGAVGFYSAYSLSELLDNAEAMIAGQTFDMRVDKFAKGKK